MRASQFLKFILEDLKGPTPKAAFIARYTGGVCHEDRKPDEISSLEFWGHHLPVHRALLKQYSSQFKTLAPKVKWKLWLEVWSKTRNYDVRSIVMMALSAKTNRDLWRTQKKDLFQLAGDIDNWALSDGLSMMLADVLEADPKSLAVYKKWNVSKNPWLRRQSLVGIYGYARFRKKPIPPQHILPLIRNLLLDSHYYVQKGVGWTLREVDRIDPALQKKFVQKHLHEISSVAWYATSELYPPKLKKQLVMARRKF